MNSILPYNLSETLRPCGLKSKSQHYRYADTHDSDRIGSLPLRCTEPYEEASKDEVTDPLEPAVA